MSSLSAPHGDAGGAPTCRCLLTLPGDGNHCEYPREPLSGMPWPSWAYSLSRPERGELACAAPAKAVVPLERRDSTSSRLRMNRPGLRMFLLSLDTRHDDTLHERARKAAYFFSRTTLNHEAPRQ